MNNQLNLPIDEYNRQFDERVASVNALIDDVDMRLTASDCPDCGRHYFGVCLCNEVGLKLFLSGVKRLQGAQMSVLSFQSEKLTTMSDSELDAQHNYLMSVYHNADNTEQGVHKANQANWYATLCLVEKNRRKNNHNQ